ncbi:MAG: YHS domain-containing protein [Candidatus Aminicenantes bacterium]|nr:YHS domain-containing protein [Candidatus Aminicenantes bacterium]
MKKDPVCGTYVPENQAVKYKDYFFCSPECKEKFQTLDAPSREAGQETRDKEVENAG